MGILSNLGHFFFGGKANQQSSGTTNQTTTGNSVENAVTNNTGSTSSYSQSNPFGSTGTNIEALLPYLQQLYTGGGGVSDLEQRGYDEVAGLSNDSSGTDAAVRENTKTLNGDYLSPDSNPYLADIANRIGSETLSKINGQFGMSGRTGSGLSSYYAGQGVGGAIGDVYNSNYQAERGRQQAAVGMAGSLDQSRYNGADALLSAGGRLTSRPTDMAGQYAGILAQLGGVGGSAINLGNNASTGSAASNTTSTGTLAGNTTGSMVGQAESSGFIGRNLNSFFESAAKAAGTQFGGGGK